MEGCRLGKCIALGYLRQVIPCHHASFTKLFHPQSPFLSFCLFFSTSFLFCHLSTLWGIGGAPTFLLIFFPPLCIEISSSFVTWHQWKGLTFLKSIFFFYWSKIFFQSCWFACEVQPALLPMLYNLENYASLNKCRGPCLYHVQVQLGTALSMLFCV